MAAQNQDPEGNVIALLLAETLDQPNVPIERLLEQQSGKRGLAAYIYLLSKINKGLSAQQNPLRQGGGAGGAG
jgi:hypothetical protein